MHFVKLVLGCLVIYFVVVLGLGILGMYLAATWDWFGLLNWYGVVGLLVLLMGTLMAVAIKAEFVRQAELAAQDQEPLSAADVGPVAEDALARAQRKHRRAKFRVKLVAASLALPGIGLVLFDFATYGERDTPECETYRAVQENMRDYDLPGVNPPGYMYDQEADARSACFNSG